MVAGSFCDKGLQNPSRNFSRFFKEFCDLQNVFKINKKIENLDYVCSADITFYDDYAFMWQENKFELFATPGHSKGSICVLVNGRYLFAGDTLFWDYPTAFGFPGGSKKDWEQISRPKLQTLNKNIQVFPGHFEQFVLKDYKFWEM